jgi:hypothetical protein
MNPLEAEEVVLICPKGDNLDCSMAENILSSEAVQDIRKALLSDVWNWRCVK